MISINYSNRSEETLVQVKTFNGQVYKADHVIVTVPLGVLKDKHKYLFTPKLPDYKVNAIEVEIINNIIPIILITYFIKK